MPIGLGPWWQSGPVHIVWIDPDGYPWMAVLVPAPTGVAYRHQYGGTACLHGEVEGYYVPLWSRDAFSQLRVLFEETLGGAGTSPRFVWSSEVANQLRDAVSRVLMAPSEGEFSPPAEALTLGENRLTEANEAWLPVTTPDRPGVLIWPNSD